MTRYLAGILLSVSLLLALGCTQPPRSLFPPGEDEPIRIIYLVSHGYHVGVVLKKVEIKQTGWPEFKEIADPEYFEVGWGDREYYTSADPGIGLAARALFLPTAGVLHLVGFKGEVINRFPGSEVIELKLSAEGFEKMVRHISRSFSRDEKGSPIFLGPGLYGLSGFYASEERYHLCKTCNTWTANVLRTAGCPVMPVSTVGALMEQLRPMGVVLQEQSEHR